MFFSEAMLLNGLLLLMGLFFIICAVKDVGFLIDSRKGQGFQKLLGRKGTRVLYGIVGVCCFVALFF